jgi:glycosyltransferase involved in cell wall biosynthesis
MRLLVLSPILPHPQASQGGAVYLGSVLEALARHAEVHLLSFVRPSELRWGAEPAGGLASARTVLLPQRHDQQRLQVLRQKLAMLWHWGVRGTPLAAAKHARPEMARAFTEQIRTHDPDVILIEFAVMAQYLRLAGGRSTVLTDHECGGATARSIGPFGLGLARDRRLWRAHVRRWYPSADLIQTVNPEDADELQRELGRPVEVRPPVVPLPDTAVDPGRAPPRVLFLGDYSHAPNPQAARHLALEVLPRVRQELPEAELWLAGPRAERQVRELQDLPGVQVLGFVADLPALLGSVRVLAAPLFAGGGTRIKVLTALAHGLPVVANRLGLRGLDVAEPAVARGETPAELAALLLRWLRDPELAARAGAAARAFAVAHASPDALAQQQLARFAALRGGSGPIRP